jgi:hypothetical protein
MLVVRLYKVMKGVATFYVSAEIIDPIPHIPIGRNIQIPPAKQDSVQEERNQQAQQNAMCGGRPYVRACTYPLANTPHH